MEIVDFIRRQLDEDERLARAAMRVNPLGLTLCLHLPPEVQQHNDRHDPARVLREVEATRRRLERHTPWQNGYKYTDPDTRVPDLRCAVCHDADPEDPIDVHPVAVEWPCPEIRDDASVYADRPGYRSEWAPADA